MELSVPCRLNVAGQWSSGCIHDVADRGMLISAIAPPPIGSYVDLRRGTLVIIGRVVWTGGNRFGIRTQDPVSLAALLAEPVLKARPATADRRRQDRDGASPGLPRENPASRTDRSRMCAARFQFVALAIVGIGIACGAAVACYRTLAAPVAAAAAALGGTVG